MFKDMYENIFNTIGDADALRAWTSYAKAKIVELKLDKTACTQSTDDPVKCFLHARQVHALFNFTFEEIANKTETEFRRVTIIGFILFHYE